MDIVQELQNLLQRLHAENIRYALCGGFALAIYGVTRATEDIDLLIEENSLVKIRKLAEDLGFRFDPQPLIFKDGGVRIYRLHKTEGEDFLLLDLLVVTPLTHAAWVSQREVQTDFGSVRVVSPAGLIHLKSLRGSGQDQDDIRQLKEFSDES